MPTIPNGSAASSLGLTQQFAPGSFEALLQQQNNDMLVKQKRQKLLPNGQPDPNAPYSSSASYRSLIGLGGM